MNRTNNSSNFVSIISPIIYAIINTRNKIKEHDDDNFNKIIKFIYFINMISLSFLIFTFSFS